MSAKTSGKTSGMAQSPAPDSENSSSLRKKISESATLKTIPGFVAAFAIGGVIIVVFFLLFSFFDFSRYFELDFWIKAIISLIIAALVLKVANVVNPQETNVSKAVPYALLTLFFCILIWHYGLRDRPVSEKEDKIENVSSDHYEFLLDKGETSPWVKFPVGYNMQTSGDVGNYKIIYDNGTVCEVIVGKENNFPDVKGKIKEVCFQSDEDGQTIKVNFVKM
ncbi:MAG TPA: hypothetical protein PK142_00450 [bacterium]|nr:hypothetical protein [bacterium]